jgi:uncharacterized membrane protein YfcA
MYTVVASFIIGILIGLTSMGGAALMTPFLVVFAGVPAVLAVGTDLVYSAITKIVGAAIHFRQGTVDLRIVKLLAIGSIPGSLLGFLFMQSLHRFGVDSNAWVRHALGLMLVVIAVVTLYRNMFLDPDPRGLPAARIAALTIGVGALVGFAVGLTSVGSGSLLAPFLMLVFPKNSARVIGTDVFHAAVLVTATSLLYINAGQVQWDLMPRLLAGSVPGVMIGSALAGRVPARGLRFGLSALLFVTGYRLI